MIVYPKAIILGVISVVFLTLGSPDYPLFGLLGWILLVYLVISVVSEIIVATSMRWLQTFSNDHPTRGESVLHTLTLSNEGPFFISSLETTIRGAMNQEQKVRHNVRPRERIVTTSILLCEHRGAYVLGLTELRHLESTGLLGMYARPEAKTFYVYPKIVDLAGLGLVPGEDARLVARESGQLREPGTRGEIIPYRPGMDTKNLLHKRLARGGSPVISKEEPREDPSLAIIIDPFTGPMQSLSNQDAVLDVAFSLANLALSLGTSFVLVAWSNGPWIVRGRTRDDFTRAWKESLGITFTQTDPGLYKLYQGLGLTTESGGSHCFVVSGTFRNTELQGLVSQVNSPWFWIAIDDAWKPDESQWLRSIAQTIPHKLAVAHDVMELGGRS